jgi:hypothetical protein
VTLRRVLVGLTMTQLNTADQPPTAIHRLPTIGGRGCSGHIHGEFMALWILVDEVHRIDRLVDAAGNRIEVRQRRAPHHRRA